MICVDDFGNEVHRCHWTDKLVSIADAVITGGMIAGVKTRYVAIKDHKEARKVAQAAFNESEANCNTCAHLKRAAHPKNSAGFLYGSCSMQENLMFHPDDPMHMQCWHAR